MLLVLYLKSCCQIQGQIDFFMLSSKLVSDLFFLHVAVQLFQRDLLKIIRRTSTFNIERPTVRGTASFLCRSFLLSPLRRFTVLSRAVFSWAQCAAVLLSHNKSSLCSDQRFHSSVLTITQSQATCGCCTLEM